MRSTYYRIVATAATILLLAGAGVGQNTTRITLEQAPAALNPAQAVRADGKTVITL